MIAYAFLLGAGTLGVIARRGIEPDLPNGLAGSFVAACCAVVMLRIHRPSRRHAGVVGATAIIVLAMGLNYARLGIRGTHLVEPDTVAIVRHAIAALGSAVTSILLLHARTRMTIPPRARVQGRRRSGGSLRLATLVGGLALTVSGLVLSTTRGPRESIAGGPAPGEVHALDGLEQMLGDERVQRLVAKAATDPRVTADPRLAALADGLRAGDVEAVRDRLDHRTLAAIGGLLADRAAARARAPEEPAAAAVSPPASTNDDDDNAVAEDVDTELDAMLARARALLGTRQGLRPEELAALRAVDLTDPRIRTRLEKLGLDPDVVERLRGGTRSDAATPGVSSPLPDGPTYGIVAGIGTPEAGPRRIRTHAPTMLLARRHETPALGTVLGQRFSPRVQTVDHPGHRFAATGPTKRSRRSVSGSSRLLQASGSATPPIDGTPDPVDAAPRSPASPGPDAISTLSPASPDFDPVRLIAALTELFGATPAAELPPSSAWLEAAAGAACLLGGIVAIGLSLGSRGSRNGI